MASIMFDSDNPVVLADPRCRFSRVATYADLLTPQLVSAFAGRLVVIDRGRGDPLGLATVANCEPGALSVAEAVGKMAQWAKEGRPFLTIYHDRDVWPEVDVALEKTGGWHWVATLDGTLAPDGRYPAAVQIASEQVAGFHVDVSIVWQEAWHPQAQGLDSAQVAKVQQLAAQALAAAQLAAKAAMGL